MRKVCSILFFTFFAFSCEKDQEYEKTKAISAFVAIDPIVIDESLKNIEITIPKQKNNILWSGSASEANQRIQNIAKNFTFKKTQQISLRKSVRFWSFYSGDIDDHFVFSPIIKDNKIFTLDTSGEVTAYDLVLKKRIWSSQIFKKKFLKNYRAPKIGYFGGKIFAVAGVNKIAAIDESDGKLLWLRDISSIPVSTPVSDGVAVYVSTNDNKLYALNVLNGELQWVQSGILRTTAIFGAADPVVDGDMVVVAYSSGEIYGINKKTGESLWSQNLNLSRATNSDFYLNDVDATPLVRDGVVYSIGNGGWMIAISAKDGKYIWRKEIAGIVDFWLADNFLFVVDNNSKLLAIHKKTGGIKWIKQLPDLKKEKKPETKILYSGVVMAGGKLLISRVDGQLVVVSPLNGEIEKNFKFDKKVFHSPAVVDDKIYLHSIGKYTIDLIEIK